MIRYEAHITVMGPPQEVFASVADFRTWSGWTDMIDITPDGDGRLHVGDGGTFALAKGPFRGKLRYETIELEPGRRVVYRITHRALDWRADLSVRASEGGAEVTNAGSVRLKGLWRLLQPLVGRELAATEAAELERLKSMLESNTPPAATAPAWPRA